MKRRVLVAALAVVAVLGFSLYTRAGARWGGGIFLDDNSRTFEGTFGGAHNSATGEFLGCRVETFDTGFVSAFCEARDESGSTRSCETTNAALVRAIESIGPDDHVKVFYSGAQQCLQVRVSKYSSHVPKRSR
jgi:hypothetical protein